MIKRSDIGPITWALWCVALGTTTGVVEVLRDRASAAIGIVRDVVNEKRSSCGHTPPDSDDGGVR